MGVVEANRGVGLPPRRWNGDWPKDHGFGGRGNDFIASSCLKVARAKAE